MCYVRFNSRLRLLGLLTSLALAAATQAGAQVPVPEVVAVPQGAFLMGSEEGATWEQPVHRVEVSGFLIGARPVTNAQFRAFRPNHKSPVTDADNAPVRAVSWEDADAYCQWLRDQTGDPYRLPTEAEWERAVRGGLEQKKYPWGNDPAVPEGAVADRNAWPPGPPNAFGLSIEYELWEWAADFYHRNYYQESPASDPPGPAEGEFRVLRGGSYPNDPNSMRCSNRGSARPRTALPNVTFRVARDATPQQISELLRPVAASAPPAREVSVPQTLARQPAPQPAPAAPTPSPTRETPAPAPPVESPAPERAAAAPPRPVPAPVEAPAPAASRAVPAAPPVPAGGAAVELTRVDATVSSVQVILALSLSGPAQYSTMELTSPDRLVIDLANTTVATARRYGSLSVGDLGVEGVRWAPFEAETPTARLVVDLMQPITFSIDTAPSGLVIQLRPR